MKPHHTITCALIAAAAFLGTPAPAQEPAPSTSETPLAEGNAPQQAALADMPINELMKAAENGDADAQTELAERYFSGRDVHVDAMLALQQLSYAVQQNNPKAQTLLGACYYSGTGVARDFSIALEWFARAASAGYPPAQMCMYAAYRDGRGVPLSDSKALQWLEKAVFAKSPEAMCEMGLIKLKGKLGTVRNVESARDMLEKARELGNAQAEKLLQLLDEAYER